MGGGERVLRCPNPRHFGAFRQFLNKYRLESSVLESRGPALCANGQHLAERLSEIGDNARMLMFF